MRVLVTGSRDFKNVDMIIDVISKLPKGTTVIHGGAPGTDILCDLVARELGFSVEVYNAEWDRWGKMAGLYRNGDMLREGKPDKVIGFRSKLNSRGTNNMLYRAGIAGVPHEIHDDF